MITVAKYLKRKSVNGDGWIEESRKDGGREGRREGRRVGRSEERPRQGF